MSLYTKYRPKDWDSVIGQDYITTILRNSIKSGRIHHAYLFHGSRGTGKTTSARILAKAISCTDIRDGNPCHECANCRAYDEGTMLDIIEIDAASNTGVDNIRELIERSRFEPNQGKYKIYIIDEVHMLSTWAFNALLKTLEEPPSHVKLILATTEIEKVPETIRSRTLRFDFRKIWLADIITRLKYVCKAEDIKAQDEALQIIAKSARGWLRDALTLLEQSMIDSEVSTEHVRYTLSLVEESLIESCIESLHGADITKIREILEVVKERHVQVRSFFEQLMYRLRDLMIEHISDPLFYEYSTLLEMLESAYGKIRSLPDGMMLIEVTLLRIAKRGDIREGWGVKSEKKESKEKKEIPQWIKDIQTQVAPSENFDTSLSKSREWVPTIENNSTFSYPALITKIKETEPALTIDLKTARFTLDNTPWEERCVLHLIFPKKWNYDRVNTPRIRNIISEVCSLTFSWRWEVKCELSASSSWLWNTIHEVF